MGDDDQLDALVDSGSLVPVDVLVDLDHSPTDLEAADLAAIVGAPGWLALRNLDLVGLNSVPPLLLSRLLEAPGVVMLEPRVDAVPFMDVATRALKARESVEYSPTTAFELGVTGQGINLCIMDTGIDDAHSALAGKFVAGVDFTKPDWPIRWARDGTFNPDDTGGHGTTCAGIATGTGAPNSDYVGAAPDANLVDLRIGTILGASPGEGPNDLYDAALQAIDWSASHYDTQWQGGEDGIDIISLSWGIPFDGPSDGTDAYSRGLDQCVNEGIVVCVAVGNEGPDNLGITGMSASSRGVIVGALNDLNTITRDDDEVAVYSTRGPRDDDGDDYPYDEMKPDVTAPGTNINGVVYERVGDGSGGGFGGRGSGTSYAAPYVAGVSALMLEANPDLDPFVLREILRATSERRETPEYPTLDPYWNGDFGFGMVDAYNATLMAMEIEDVGSIDVEIQAFITNVSGGSSKDPMLTAEGIAWARVGGVSHVEWRMDLSDWASVNLEGGDFSFDIDPSQIGEGTHVLEVRAIGHDGLNSVWRPVDVEITKEAVDAAFSASGSMAGWCYATVAVLVVAGLFVWKRRPDLLNRGLRIFNIER